MVKRTELGTFGTPITDTDIEDGHRLFVHEILAELEIRLELHEQREEKMLEAIKRLLKVIDDMSVRLQGGEAV